MSEVSTAYGITEHLHDSFLAKNGVLSDAEIESSGVIFAFGAVTPNVTERLHVAGRIDGRPAYQSLAKDKLGNFHLSTVFTDYGGPHIQHDIRDTAEPELSDTIVESLFMKALTTIVCNRAYNRQIS